MRNSLFCWQYRAVHVMADIGLCKQRPSLLRFKYKRIITQERGRWLMILCNKKEIPGAKWGEWNLYPIRRMVYPHHARTDFPAANAKTAASKTKPVMMQHMATDVPSENTARSTEEIMPLPYWSTPMSAVAEPVISSGALESAATCTDLRNSVPARASSPCCLVQSRDYPLRFPLSSSLFFSSGSATAR